VINMANARTIIKGNQSWYGVYSFSLIPRRSNRMIITEIQEIAANYFNLK